MQEQPQRGAANTGAVGNNEEIMYEISRKADVSDVADLTRVKASNLDVDRNAKGLLLLTVQLEFFAQAVQQNAQIDALRHWLADGIIPANVEALFPHRKIPDVNEMPSRFKEENTLTDRLEAKFGIVPP